MQQPEKQPQPGSAERDHASMGAAGGTTTSSRAGFIPISLEQLPVESLAELPVYVRLAADHPLAKGTDDQDGNGFRLYASPQVRFAELHRRRLRDHGVKFVYIRTSDHTKFRKQTEARLEAIAVDPSIAAAQRAAIVYDTSKELINELLAEPTFASVPALQKVSQSVTSTGTTTVGPLSTAKKSRTAPTSSRSATGDSAAPSPFTARTRRCAAGFVVAVSAAAAGATATDSGEEFTVSSHVVSNPAPTIAATTHAASSPAVLLVATARVYASHDC